MAVYEYDSQNQELKRIAGGTLYADCPIGFILPSFETVAPLGFLKLTDTLANRTVSRTTYKELFDWATSRNLIGTGKPFGVGDGSTTFVIPDGKEIAFKGVGEYEGTVGAHVKSGGLAVGEFIDDRLQEHIHNVGATASGGSTKFGFASKNAQVLSYEEPTSSNTGRKGATTEVKSLGCHYYIKAKQIGAPADFVDAIEDVIEEKFSYSTTEVNTGKKWLDGKPIYSRSFSVAGIGTETWTNVTNDSWINSISRIIDCVVSADSVGYGNYGGHPKTRIDNGYLQAWEVAGYSAGVMTIEYTKTT